MNSISLKWKKKNVYRKKKLSNIYTSDALHIKLMAKCSYLLDCLQIYVYHTGRKYCILDLHAFSSNNEVVWGRMNVTESNSTECFLTSLELTGTVIFIIAICIQQTSNIFKCLFYKSNTCSPTFHLKKK